MQICADKRNFLSIFVCLFLNAMIQVIQLKGKDKHLYQLLAPLVMDPDVIRANNNYPFKTNEDFVWYIAIDNREVVGFVPIEQKSGKKAVINNYYVAAVDEQRKDILSLLLSSIVTAFIPEGWTLDSVTLIQDQETFEKFEFTSMDKKWTRYVKMNRLIMGKKTITGTKNVYELAQERLKVIFNEFDNIYVSFSGGKDSGVLLNMCIDYIRRNNLKIRLGVFHMDYEIQYKMTIDYVDRILEANKDILDVYRVCVPFRVSTCTSMYQSFWRPWEDNKKDIWVRSMPKKAMKKEDFPFYNTTMWDYEFQMRFAQWIHQKKDAVRTCCLIGIRTQESFNRWRCIYMSRKFQMYHKYKWTSKVGNDIYNAYPIFDWKTTDVWTANGKFQWDYNILYDLYYRAGVNLERQRVASPFINEAQESLALYRVLDPNTWGKMIGRVNGVNFTGMYGGTHAMGWQSVKLPEGYTWREFMYFLLSTLPERARKNYLRKLSVSVHFWRTKGGCLSDATIQKLIDAKVPIIVMDNSNYKTYKKPVRMEYQDDIDIPEFREIPTYKRMCVCILKNDHACKYMGFSPTKEEMSKRSQVMEQYRIIVS